MSNPIHVALANKFSCVWARSILLIFFFLPWGLINVFRPSCNYLLYCSLVWVRIYATHCEKGWFVIGLDHHVNIFFSSSQAQVRIYPTHCERDDGEIEFQVLKHYQKLHRNRIYNGQIDPFVFTPIYLCSIWL